MENVLWWNSLKKHMPRCKAAGELVSQACVEMEWLSTGTDGAWLSHLLPVSVVLQLLSCVRLFATPWTVAGQASLSFTISWSLLTLMSIESVMPSNYLILCHSFVLSLSLHQSFF